MATITKKELIDRIAEGTGHRRGQVKRVVQQFLGGIGWSSGTLASLKPRFAKPAAPRILRP
jgi:hypothetical protein